MALTDRLTAIADAIREKNGSTELMQPADMPSLILSLSSGAEYESIVYNEDNSIVLTDKNGTVHTMECEYSEDGKLIAISYDGKPIELTYEDDLLVKVGETAIDLSVVESGVQLKLIETLVGDVTPIQQELEIASAMLGGR